LQICQMNQNLVENSQIKSYNIYRVQAFIKQEERPSGP
jgi:hypothetical protein